MKHLYEMISVVNPDLYDACEFLANLSPIFKFLAFSEPEIFLALASVLLESWEDLFGAARRIGGEGAEVWNQPSRGKSFSGTQVWNYGTRVKSKKQISYPTPLPTFPVDEVDSGKVIKSNHVTSVYAELRVVNSRNGSRRARSRYPAALPAFPVSEVSSGKVIKSNHLTSVYAELRVVSKTKTKSKTRRRGEVIRSSHITSVYAELRTTLGLNPQGGFDSVGGLLRLIGHETTHTVQQGKRQRLGGRINTWDTYRQKRVVKFKVGKDFADKVK